MSHKCPGVPALKTLKEIGEQAAIERIAKRLPMDGGIVLGAGICLLWSMPLIWSVIASLRPLNEPFARGQVWFGSGLSVANFRRAFSLTAAIASGEYHPSARSTTLYRRVPSKYSPRNAPSPIARTAMAIRERFQPTSAILRSWMSVMIRMRSLSSSPTATGLTLIDDHRDR